LITESLLLSLLGSVLGLLVASTIIAATRKIAGHTLMAVDNVTLSPTVLAFTMLTAVLTGTLFGLIPAFSGSKPALVSSLKGTGAAAGNAGRGLLRDLLVVGQVGLALALLIGAALLVRSVRRLSSVDPGFDAAGVVSSDIALPYAKYGQTPATVQFYDRLLEQVRSRPGVESAGLVSTLPLTDFDTVGFEFEGQAKSWGRDLEADRYVISPDYLRTMHIALRSGRSVAVTDTADTSPVVLVNETMGRRIWPNGDVIGRRIRVPGDRPAQPWRTVVGIVADVKQYSLDHQPTMQIYLPYRQVPWNYMTLAVRTTTHPAASLLAMLRKQAGTIDADAAFSDPLKLEEILHDSIESRRFTMVMLLGFSLLAVSLASVGIYGVLSYLVTCRTREFGVRLALGASPIRIVTLVMLRGGTLALLGATLGLGLGLTVSRAITSMLFAVSPRDLGSFVVATTGVVCVAFVACYIPARHASKVDPMVALRYD
jgi:putative ABC transport system permease protein